MCVLGSVSPLAAQLDIRFLLLHHNLRRTCTWDSILDTLLLKESRAREKEKGKKSLAIVGIRTHNLLMTCRALYHCSTAQ